MFATGFVGGPSQAVSQDRTPQLKDHSRPMRMRIMNPEAGRSRHLVDNALAFIVAVKRTCRRLREGNGGSLHSPAGAETVDADLAEQTVRTRKAFPCWRSSSVFRGFSRLIRKMKGASHEPTKKSFIRGCRRGQSTGDQCDLSLDAPRMRDGWKFQRGRNGTSLIAERCALISPSGRPCSQTPLPGLDASDRD